jgi:uncharacterized protein (TIGR03085 family)
VSASKHARRERQDLAELMLAVGPDAPTLCEGWTTRDLAAHLVVRESRPDAGIGIVVPAMAGWTQRVQNSAAATPFPELVRRVRTGPPTLSLFSLPGADGLANLVEYFVHLEDVRRAQPDWQPRDLTPEFADELWGRISSMGRLLYRRVPVGVRLVRTDGPGGEIVVKSGSPEVTLSGAAGELVLRSYGRRAVHLDVSGEPEAVAVFEASRLSI